MSLAPLISYIDVTALVTVDFAATAINFSVPDEHRSLKRLVRRYFKPIQYGCVAHYDPQTEIVRRLK
jgi:hypothetical protein